MGCGWCGGDLRGRKKYCCDAHAAKHRRSVSNPWHLVIVSSNRTNWRRLRSLKDLEGMAMSGPGIFERFVPNPPYSGGGR
jgi:hypothetical protein